MNSSNIVTPQNNPCSRVLSQQLRLCPAFLGKQEFGDNGFAGGTDVCRSPLLWPREARSPSPPSRAGLLGLCSLALGGFGKGYENKLGRKDIFSLFAAFYCHLFTASRSPGRRRQQRRDAAAGSLLWRGRSHPGPQTKGRASLPEGWWLTGTPQVMPLSPAVELVRVSGS